MNTLVSSITCPAAPLENPAHCALMRNLKKIGHLIRLDYSEAWHNRVVYFVYNCGAHNASVLRNSEDYCLIHNTILYANDITYSNK